MDSLIYVLPILLLLSMAAFVSELAGALNIAIEGIMLLGSFLVTVNFIHPLGLVPGMALAVGAGFFLGLILGILHSKFGANIFIAGLGMNMLAASASTILGQILYGTKGLIRFNSGLMPLQIHTIFVISAAAIFLFIFISYSWSLMGLRFRSLANHSEMLHARGVNIIAYRTWALAFSGGLAAFAGALSSISLGAFVPQGTNGQGWIALVLVYVGAKHPLGILLACLVYIFLQDAGTRLQSSLDNPALALGLPYVGILLVLVLVQVISRKKIEL